VEFQFEDLDRSSTLFIEAFKMANAATIDIAREVRDHLAGSALTERQAKLYSQRLRLDMGQDGLASFAPGDVDSYLEEAMLLIQCGLLERNANPESAWRLSIKRAEEIMEWLSQSRLKPSDVPLHLLAAARLPTRRLSCHGTWSPALCT
jgi:hypothetical protein